MNRQQMTTTMISKSIAGPSIEVAPNDDASDEDSDDDTTKPATGRKDNPTTMSTTKHAPTSAPSTQPSNSGRKSATTPTPRKDVSARLVKVARAMKKLETFLQLQYAASMNMARSAIPTPRILG